MATLNDFITQVKEDGLARQNRFGVLITQPTGMLNGGYPLELIQLFCEQAVLPGVAFSTQPVKTFGEDREVVYDRNYEDVTLTFLVDRNLHVKTFFDDWCDLIIDPTTRLTGFYSDYISTIEIYVEDMQDRDVYTTIMYEAYPKSVGQIQLDNNSKDVMKMSVTFAYKFHINEQILTPGGEPEIMTQYQQVPYIQDAPSKKQSIRDYLKGSLKLPLNIPDQYFTDFSKFQQTINDSFSARNATSMLERAGLISGTGGLFT